jgi:hypothetical protein
MSCIILCKYVFGIIVPQMQIKDCETGFSCAKYINMLCSGIRHDGIWYGMEATGAPESFLPKLETYVTPTNALIWLLILSFT